jgi:hypothetical protein
VFLAVDLIFIGSNAHKFLDVSKELVVAVCVPPLIGFSLLKHMKELAYVALLADFMCILGLLLVLNIDLGYMEHDHDSLEAIGVVSAVPFFFGVASYCFEGVGMVLPLENSMRNKRNFTPILVCTVVIITTLYATFGICGYLAFGNDTNAVITLNFEGSGGLVKLVKVCLCLGVRGPATNNRVRQQGGKPTNYSEEGHRPARRSRVADRSDRCWDPRYVVNSYEVGVLYDPATYRLWRFWIGTRLRPVHFVHWLHVLLVVGLHPPGILSPPSIS